MVLQLLTLRRLCAEKGASGINKVLALVVNFLIYKEIFLLGADGGFTDFTSVSEKL